MIGVTCTDGVGGKQKARVTDNALVVTQYACPPLLPQKNRIFRQYFTDDGLSTGDEDMQIEAVAAPKEYWISANEDADRYITQVSFVIGDGAANLNEFGNIAALTNGCEFYYSYNHGKVTIHEGLKSNWDFVRMCLGNPFFGDAASAFRATNVEGGAEAYCPVMDFTKIMPPYGVKLDMGSDQRLVMNIRDRTDEVDVFNAIAYGFDRFE